eukprot:7099151-Pyramimonas_sp.AAC.1
MEEALSFHFAYRTAGQSTTTQHCPRGVSEHGTILPHASQGPCPPRCPELRPRPPPACLRGQRLS